MTTQTHTPAKMIQNS